MEKQIAYVTALSPTGLYVLFYRLKKSRDSWDRLASQAHGLNALQQEILNDAIAYPDLDHQIRPYEQD